MASSTYEPVILPTTTTSTNQHFQTLPPQQPFSNNININSTTNNINNNNNISHNNNSVISNNINNNGGSCYNPKKRSLEYDYVIQNSPYFKMRLLLQDLRPLALQTLRHPDFLNSEAGRAFLEKMKLMVDTCRQHAVSVPKCNSGAGTQALPSEKQGNHRIPGTYIVGGSAFGWNFITFHGTKPEYYGRTKESFRAGK